MTKRCPMCGGFISDERLTGILKPKLKCPRCDSTRNWKDGKYDELYGRAQRYLCRDCGYRFSEK